MKLVSAFAAVAVAVIAAVPTQSAPVPIFRDSSDLLPRGMPSSASVGSSYDKYPVHDEVKAPSEPLSARGQLPELIEGLTRTVEGTMDSLPPSGTSTHYPESIASNDATKSVTQMPEAEPHSVSASSRTDALSLRPSKQITKRKPHDSHVTYTTRTLGDRTVDVPDKIRGKRRSLKLLKLTKEQLDELAKIEHTEYVREYKVAKPEKEKERISREKEKRRQSRPPPPKTLREVPSFTPGKHRDLSLLSQHHKHEVAKKRRRLGEKIRYQKKVGDRALRVQGSNHQAAHGNDRVRLLFEEPAPNAELPPSTVSSPPLPHLSWEEIDYLLSLHKDDAADLP